MVSKASRVIRPNRAIQPSRFSSRGRRCLLPRRCLNHPRTTRHTIRLNALLCLRTSLLSKSLLQALEPGVLTRSCRIRLSRCLLRSAVLREVVLSGRQPSQRHLHLAPLLVTYKAQLLSH